MGLLTLQANYGCEKCGKTYTDLRSCQSHIRGVHHEARHMCKCCGKMFKRRCDLYQHERRHNTASLPCKVSYVESLLIYSFVPTVPITCI